ncbi:MAG: glycosyltransferase family 2 protein [Myxococcota bacterium]
MRVSVVIPVFNEEPNLAELYRRIVAVLESEREPFEIVFVDDGSTDRSRSVLLTLHKADPRVVVLALSRNFGHQLALTAGVDHARGEAIVVMDADLQDPPEVIPELLAQWREGFDVVYGVRSRRNGESLVKRGTAWAFYRLLRTLIPLDVPLDAGDFRLYSRRAADALVRLREQHRFVRGMARWVGFRQAAVPYERDARYAGRTKYSLWRMLALATDAVFAFSKVPLRLATAVGALTAVLCVAYASWAVWVKLTADEPLIGWASTMVAILLVGSVQLMFMGIIGEYIGRIHDEVRARPLYLVGDLARAEPAEEPLRVLPDPT